LIKTRGHGGEKQDITVNTVNNPILRKVGSRPATRRAYLRRTDQQMGKSTASEKKETVRNTRVAPPFLANPKNRRGDLLCYRLKRVLSEKGGGRGVDKQKKGNVRKPFRPLRRGAKQSSAIMWVPQLVGKKKEESIRHRPPHARVADGVFIDGSVSQKEGKRARNTESNTAVFLFPLLDWREYRKTQQGKKGYVSTKGSWGWPMLVLMGYFLSLRRERNSGYYQLATIRPDLAHDVHEGRRKWSISLSWRYWERKIT